MEGMSAAELPNVPPVRDLGHAERALEWILAVDTFPLSHGDLRKRGQHAQLDTHARGVWQAGYRS